VKECEAYGQRQGIDVVEVFKDAGESGSTINRPELQRLLAYCRANKGRVQLLIVRDVTRLSRNGRDYAQIRESLSDLGVTLRSANDPVGADAVVKLTDIMQAIGNEQTAEWTKLDVADDAPETR